jgi:hypothetical protein
MNTPTRMDIWRRWLENAIAYVSPVWAFRRAQARQAREDEERRERQRRADARDRRDGWRPIGQHPPGDRSWLQQRRDVRRRWHWGG